MPPKPSSNPPMDRFRTALSNGSSSSDGATAPATPPNGANGSPSPSLGGSNRCVARALRRTKPTRALQSRAAGRDRSRSPRSVQANRWVRLRSPETPLTRLPLPRARPAEAGKPDHRDDRVESSGQHPGPTDAASRRVVGDDTETALGRGLHCVSIGSQQGLVPIPDPCHHQLCR